MHCKQRGPSVSIETETTHLTCSPSLPGLPTVFITSRVWAVKCRTHVYHL